MDPEQTVGIFDEHWLARARAQGSHASAFWSQAVLEYLDTTGGMYLRTLRQWFADFPLSARKQKQQLKTRLESFDDDTHRGVVNELAWWIFMQRLGLQAAPVLETTEPRPDFHVQASVAFFVEVSTVNPSQRERAKFDIDEDEGESEYMGVPLDHAETCRRFMGKVTDEKKRQMEYAASQHQPCVLALFDYTIWSAYPTWIVSYMADFLLGEEQGFQQLPPILSALVYVRRHVMNGRIALRRDLSAIYYNPHTDYPLPTGIFAAIKQFGCQAGEGASQLADPWIWL
jgi:hypothetical protein